MLSWYFANYVPVPCYTEYSSLLNYMGLNYAGLLTHNFLQYCTINECSIPNGFNIFSLAHFIIRNTVYKTYIYKICVSWLFILSVRLAVNSRVSVIKCLGNQKLYVNFWQHKGGRAFLIPMFFKSILRYQSLPLNWARTILFIFIIFGINNACPAHSKW